MIKLHKRDYAGRLRVWWAEIDQSGTRYRTHSGLHGGSIVTSDWTVVQGNAQRPDAVDQCTFEVDALYRHHLARTYHKTVAETVGGAHYFEPMLAQPLDRKRIKLNQLRSSTDDVLLYIQPKLDGMRCIVSADGMFSRKGKEIISAPHIQRALDPFFAQNPDAILDGEIYSEKLADNFQFIMSLVRKTKPTDTDLLVSKQFLQLHLYDAPHLADAPYAERYNTCRAAAAASRTNEAQNDPIFVIETICINSWEEWDVQHAHWCEKGFEGSMSRSPLALYQKRRTHDLIKRKDFDTAEFRVAAVGEGEGNWAGACKRIWCWLPSATGEDIALGNITDETTFVATPRGAYGELVVLLNGPLPAEVTVRYLGWTTSDIPKPRHAIATDIHMHGRVD